MYTYVSHVLLKYSEYDARIIFSKNLKLKIPYLRALWKIYFVK